MNIQDLIAAKRDGRKHTSPELDWLARSAAKGEIPDYQLAAWLMAAYIRRLDPDETAWLTLAMAGSGERMDLTGLPKPWVDKHSTGGVGDKTTIVLLPLLAACGLTVIKMSGRGLGITGGTVDKLLSVPGFRMDLSPEELKEQAKRIGLAISGQTPNLAPADKVLYALRDATTTVESNPLIVSSILSKKLAGGADTIVLDVKAGSGAFMKSVDSALELAHALKETAIRVGLDVHLAITDMSQPLGRTVGNALEIEEAGAVLTGNEPSRFSNLCLDLAALTLVASGLIADPGQARRQAEEALANGFALRKAEEWFEAQGADPTVLVRPDKLPTAPVRKYFESESDGWIAGIDAGAVGEAVIELGGGRIRKEDSIDPRVGVEVHAEVGSKVARGQRLLTVHAADGDRGERVCRKLASAIRISSVHQEPVKAVIEKL